ncbi:MAG: hypothetical protein ACWGOY_03465 [Anaerolineales bacterium]
MRRVVLWVAVLLVSCQAVSPIDPSPTVPASPAPASLKTGIPPAATPQATEFPTATPEPDFKVILHPDGSLYVGDQISIEVISLGGLDLKDKNVQIEVNGLPEEQSSAGFNEFGIGGRLQATFNWIWDTSDLEPGEYKINFKIMADGPAWTETVYLQPGEDLPNPEPAARWETVMLDCCVIHFISGTDFAQDLPYLGDVIQKQAEEAVLTLGVDFDQRIPITILPRVLGHGGFAANEIYVSYIEDNYAGNDLTQVLYHEMIHILDRRLGGDLRPSLFVEGLAVYLSHGHFKKEPLMSRAAALQEMGWYLPLAELADSFYTRQHEIGYLEGAALVGFMVNQYGWEAFNDFYRDIHPHPSDSEARAIDDALQEHFKISLQQLEGMFTAELKSMHINPDMRADLIQSVNYYDTVRRYQIMLDPSAYFLTAWLPAGEEMRERGIVADYLRWPEDQRNLEIVELLVDVDQQIRAGNYLQAEKALWLANQKLDLVQSEVLKGN